MNHSADVVEAVERREIVARIVDGQAWKQREHHLERLQSWQATIAKKGANDTSRRLVEINRRLSEEAVAPSLAKADAILSALSQESERSSSSVAGVPCPQMGNPTPGHLEVLGHFQWNEGWKHWEQVVPEAAGEPGVVTAYRLATPSSQTEVVEQPLTFSREAKSAALALSLPSPPTTMNDALHTDGEG